MTFQIMQAVQSERKRSKKKPTGKENRPVSKNVSAHKQGRRSKRVLSAVKYTEKDVPPFDAYIYCDNCEEEYAHKCPKCGVLPHFLDKRVPMGTKDRARKTVPKGILEVRPSPIHGEGVFALKPINKGVKFGPYEGIELPQKMESGYAWQIRGGRLVDAKDVNCSNWLRYVNCARNIAEQNVAAFQYLGKMYYRTVANISAGKELLVFYGKSYARDLGIDVDSFFNPDVEVQDEMFACVPCCFGFARERDLLKHKMRCPNDLDRQEFIPEGEYICRYCDIRIGTKSFLVSHEKVCNGKYKRSDFNKKFKCADCRYATKWKSILVRHIRIHTGDRPFKCQKCNYRTTRKYDLERHIRMKHSAEKPFKCNLCTYNSASICNLRQHKLIHLPEKKFLCKICVKGFNGKKQLADHMFKHNDKPMPFKCDKCQYHTCNFGNLKQHKIDKHTKIKTFKCKLCGHKTSQKAHLIAHIYTHTGNKPYKCLKCEAEFIGPGELQKHIEKKHKKKPAEMNCSHRRNARTPRNIN